MSTRDVVLCAPVRTAVGTYNGTLKDMPAVELGATAIRACLERAAIGGDEVGTVVMGNVIQAGNKMNPARQAAIGGGMPVEVPAHDRQSRLRLRRPGDRHRRARSCSACSTRRSPAGWRTWIAAPYLMYGGRWGYRMGHAQIYDAMLHDGLNDAFSGEHSGWHTEDLVAKYQITREDQDRWALRSQERFAAAQAAGRFDAEIAPVEVKSRKGPQPFAKDEHNRPETTAESLAKLKPAFRKDGTITAGNAPGLNSGAAAMIVAERGWAERKGLQPMGRLVSRASARWSRACSASGRCRR